MSLIENNFFFFWGGGRDSPKNNNEAAKIDLSEGIKRTRRRPNEAIIKAWSPKILCRLWP